jgi:hypothetical protein
MTLSRQWETGGVVAGVHLAASAQPPRATSPLTPRFASLQSPQPIPPVTALRTNGTRQESLGCCGLPPAPPMHGFLGGTKPQNLGRRQ